MSGHKRPARESPPASDSLESWKEIAAYLRRGVRTVRRWEKEEGLPVHRQLHKTLGTVYAHRHEIDAWRESRHTTGRPAGRRPAARKVRTRIMLAVLPFEDLSRRPGETWIGDGLTDEMISRLGRLRPDALGVIARTTVMQYKDTGRTVRQIGEELAVDYVVEGSVRHEANRVRVTARLIQVTDQTQVWAGQYEQSIGSILALQRDLAGEIGGRIHAALAPAAAPAQPIRQVRPEAYLAWLKGRHLLNRFTTDSVERAIECFAEAIRIDPGYAAAHASLAEAYAHRPVWLELPSAGSVPLAMDAARTALALDPDLPEAWTSLGLVHACYLWDWAAAERYFLRALELNPGCVAAGQWYAEFLAELGRGAEALEMVDRARVHDPLAPSLQASAAFVLWLDRRYDDALARAAQALELDPHHPMALIRRGVAQLTTARFEEAAASFEAARHATPRLLACTSLLGWAYALGGKRDDALGQLQLLHRSATTRHVPDFLFANIHFALGELAEALQSMEREWDARGWYMLLLNRSPLFDALRSHPRFVSLLQRLHFPDASDPREALLPQAGSS